TAVLEILILAGFAAFVAYRLYSVLGRRTGNEQPPFDPLSRRERIETRTASSSKDDKVIQLPRGRDVARPQTVDPVEASIPAGSALALGIAQIRQADRSFEADGFLSGAKAAHEMIARAYAQGDRETLRSLLAEDVYASFDAAIGEREKAGRKV